MTIALGFESSAKSTANFPYSGNNVYSSQRFTSPHNVVISGLSILVQQYNWDGSDNVGIQGNNGGVPDNLYLTSGVFFHNSGGVGAYGGGNGSIFNVSLPMIQLNSGTIYHLVLQPSGTIGVGSRTTLAISSLSGVNAHFYTRLLGSLFNCAIDDNTLKFLSYTSGETWNAGSVASLGRRPTIFMIRESGGLIASKEEFGLGVYLNVFNNSLTSIELEGTHFRIDNKTYNISGVFSRISNVGQGSLWCRLEYSGVMIGGLRTEIGSVMFNQPLSNTSINSTPQFFAELHAGSKILAWLYGSGINFDIPTNDDVSPYNNGSGIFGLGSAANITSIDNGSTITFNINRTTILYFAASGADGIAETLVTPYNLGNSFGGNINFYG